MNFLNLSETNAPMMEELVAAASGVIRSGCYLHGPQTRTFESELAALHGAKYAVAVSNGLDALRLMVRAYLEMGALHPGDGVMVAANTYIATVLPITEFGLVPVFVEPDSDTMNFSWSTALKILDDNASCKDSLRISAALVTHLYGTPCWDAEAALEMRRRGMLVLEDNAQAIGAMANSEGFNGTRHTGNLGDAAAFSFYPTKNLGGLGDGGALLTCDKTLADTVRALANYGSDRRYHNIYEGFNCRLDEIQAAMLRVKLGYLDQETERRNRVAAIYSKEITNPEVTLPRRFPDMVQVWHQYVVLLPEGKRDAARELLAGHGIATDVHYPEPPYLQPCYAPRYAPKGITASISLSRRCISLPIANVSEEDAREVARIINNFYDSTK